MKRNEYTFDQRGRSFIKYGECDVRFHGSGLVSSYWADLKWFNAWGLKILDFSIDELGKIIGDE